MAGPHHVVQQFPGPQDLDEVVVPGGAHFRRQRGDAVEGGLQVLLDLGQHPVGGGQSCPHLEGGVAVRGVEVEPGPGPVGGRGDQFGELRQRTDEGAGRFLDDPGDVLWVGRHFEPRDHARHRVGVGGWRREVPELEGLGGIRSVGEADVVLHRGPDRLADRRVVLRHRANSTEV